LPDASSAARFPPEWGLETPEIGILQVFRGIPATVYVTDIKALNYKAACGCRKACLLRKLV